MNIQDIIGTLESQLNALEEMESIPPEKKVDALSGLGQVIDILVDISEEGYGCDDGDDYYEEEDQ